MSTSLYFSNTLTGKKDEFKPNKKDQIGIYSCGPTVYWNQHIGHMYAYVHWDLLVRFLRSLGYKVTWVMNVTDVGHMTSDEDAGEDKMEKGAKREGVDVWELADKYIDQFKDSMKLLNITSPDVLPRATDHIEEQINLIKEIEKKGYAYKTDMGVVFDTSKFPGYAEFAGLELSKQKTRNDVEIDKDKKNPWDFLLWVTGNTRHIMQWDSPWGRGYPGWHIECTAMSTKYLGNNFDIHTGGIEHIGVHHTNEIAQGYAAFGKQTANYWLHNAWLTGKSGEKMSKSLGNYVTAQDLVERGYDPLALRYLILNSHYKKGLQFSFAALDAAQQALQKLKSAVVGLKAVESQRQTLSSDKLAKTDEFGRDLNMALADDLSAPKALSVVWEMLKSNIPSGDKYDLLMTFNDVLGLGLEKVDTVQKEIPSEIIGMAKKREELRKAGKYEDADIVRKKIEGKGFLIKDSASGFIIKAKN